MSGNSSGRRRGTSSPSQFASGGSTVFGARFAVERALLSAGTVGPALFVSIFTVDGVVRPGYDPASIFVSGPVRGGRLQQASFVVTGIMSASSRPVSGGRGVPDARRRSYPQSWRSSASAMRRPACSHRPCPGVHPAVGTRTYPRAARCRRLPRHADVLFLVAARSRRDARSRRWRSSTLAVGIPGHDHRAAQGAVPSCSSPVARADDRAEHGLSSAVGGRVRLLAFNRRPGSRSASPITALW